MRLGKNLRKMLKDVQNKKIKIKGRKNCRELRFAETILIIIGEELEGDSFTAPLWQSSGSGLDICLITPPGRWDPGPGPGVLEVLEEEELMTTPLPREAKVEPIGGGFFLIQSRRDF